jgi:glycosyltransferase involved in cell wall biosynthesis
LGLSYILVLYTGGQAIPGQKMFDNHRDFLHHVTNVYLPETGYIAAHRQWVLPHFINDDFKYNPAVTAALKQQAVNKKIVISVGLLDKATKRMDMLVQVLAAMKHAVFPVLMGEVSNDTDSIDAQLQAVFGAGNYLLGTVPHEQLGDYYRAADVFVLCSPKESFGLAAVEALSFGLPVVSADFPEAHFVLRDKVVFVSSNEPEDWSRAIWGVLEKNIAGDGSKDSRADFVQGNYAWRSLKPAYVQLFNTMTSSKTL